MTKRIKAIDYIKAFCILMVIIGHCEVYSVYGKKLLMPFYVDLAVPCFLMLSGYTLSIRMQKRLSFDNSTLCDLVKNYCSRKSIEHSRVISGGGVYYMT